ncbi:MAG: hypothetical protein SW833_15305 [Cyanobacteriota bacterium]|nr:hypothetical protein [Cyanobacteriota bacterium]
MLPRTVLTFNLTSRAILRRTKARSHGQSGGEATMNFEPNDSWVDKSRSGW